MKKVQLLYRFSSQNGFPMLTRDFIYDRLYDREEGYFTNQKQLQLGQLKKMINFQELLGYEDYMNQLQENYPENAWLTPSEIFRPYYGITIGNYIFQQYNFIKTQNPNVKQIRILEAGAGYGAACEGILTFLKQFNPFLLNQLEYHIVELSGLACQVCEKRLIEQGFGDLLKRGVVRIVNQDVLSYAPNSNPTEAWFLLFLEVFDNLPQDRVYGNIGEGPLRETWVNRSSDGSLVEELREAQDPLILETSSLYAEFIKTTGNNGWEADAQEKTQSLVFLRRLIMQFYGSRRVEQNIFLPTQSLKLMKHIAKSFPYTRSMVVADFDMLNNQYTPSGLGAPIVSTKGRKPHEKKDFSDYLVERGQADIFFPTNFAFMKFLHRRVLKQPAKVIPAHEFVEQFSKSQWTTTRSGYNPLKEDFANTSFLLCDHQK